MKFTVTQHDTIEGWIIRIGSKKSDGSMKWTGYKFDSKADATREANFLNAKYLLEKVVKMIPDMSLDSAKNLGHTMNAVIDTVTDRVEAEDSAWTAHDGRGWLA